MKNKFKKAFISGAIMATGLAVGFAASTALQDLEAIKVNFDYILGINKSQKSTIEEQESTIGELNTQNTNKQGEINELSTKITKLEDEIAELKKTQNNSGKQKRINELEEQVAGLIAERDSLITQRDNLSAANSELETAINNLKVYTDTAVDEVAE